MKISKAWLWLLIPGGTLLVLFYFFFIAKRPAPTAFNGAAGGTGNESGNPVSGDNNPQNSPGGTNNPLNPGNPPNLTV